MCVCVCVCVCVVWGGVSSVVDSQKGERWEGEWLSYGSEHGRGILLDGSRTRQESLGATPLRGLGGMGWLALGGGQEKVGLFRPEKGPSLH
jgi:hypothetical protein